MRNSELNDMMTREGDILIDFEIRTKDTAKYKKACNMIKNYVANFVLTKGMMSFDSFPYTIEPKLMSKIYV